MIYYTADLHLFDDRIIKMCNRPYSDMDKMCEDIIEKWNQKIKKNDEVYILGDMLSSVTEKTLGVINQLSGKKTLVCGNHDEEWIKDFPNIKEMFYKICNLISIKDGNRDVTLCHYPLLSFKESTRDGYHIYGHIHNNQNEVNYEFLLNMKNCFNAGVDVNDFEPKSLDELIEGHI